MKFKVSKCYETWSNEAYETGDTDDRGFEYKDQKMSISEILKEIEDNGITSPSCYPLNNRNISQHIWLSTVDGYQNYQTGETTHYSLHIKGSKRQMRRIFRLANIN